MNEKNLFASPLFWSLTGVVLAFLVIGGFIVKVLLKEDDSSSRRFATVTLVKPPSSPLVKRSQEPEPAKERRPLREDTEEGQKGTVSEAASDAPVYSSATPPPSSHSQAESPAVATVAPESGPPYPTAGSAASYGEPSAGGDGGPASGGPIGLDTVGTGGGDAFGLVARRGGRSIIASGGGTAGRGMGAPSGEAGPMVAYKAPVSKPAPKVVKIGGNPTSRGEGGAGIAEVSLLEKFGWYADKVKYEVTAQVRRQIEENRQIPRGKFQTVIRISLDSSGTVIETQIIGSSGNQEVDEMVKRSLANLTINEPPPDGMPKNILIRVTSQSG